MNGSKHGYTARGGDRGGGVRADGFTLVETVLAVGITALVVVTMVSLMPFGLETLREASGRAADARVLQALHGRYEMQDWASVEAQEAAGATRDFYFDDKGVAVEEADPTHLYTARVSIGPPPLVPGDGLENPYLRRMIVVISDRPPESGDPFEEGYATRTHSALLAKIDR